VRKAKKGNAEYIELNEIFMVNYVGGYWPRFLQIKEDVEEDYSTNSKRRIDEYRNIVGYVRSMVFRTLFNKEERDKGPIFDEKKLNYFLVAFYLQQREALGLYHLDGLFQKFSNNKKINNLIQRSIKSHKNKKEKEISKGNSSEEIVREILKKTKNIDDKTGFLEGLRYFYEKELKVKEYYEVHRRLAKNIQILELQEKEKNNVLDSYEVLTTYTKHLDHKYVFPMLTTPRKGFTETLAEWMDEGILYFATYEPNLFKILNLEREGNSFNNKFRLQGPNIMIWDDLCNGEFMRAHKDEFPKSFIKQNAFIFEQSNNKQKAKKTLSHKDKK
jgi:hypothetical protein